MTEKKIPQSKVHSVEAHPLYGTTKSVKAKLN